MLRHFQEFQKSIQHIKNVTNIFHGLTIPYDVCNNRIISSRYFQIYIFLSNYKYSMRMKCYNRSIGLHFNGWYNTSTQLLQQIFIPTSIYVCRGISKYIFGGGEHQAFRPLCQLLVYMACECESQVVYIFVCICSFHSIWSFVFI